MFDLSVFMPLFTAIIAFFALLSGVIKMFITPMEKDIKSLKEGQKKLEAVLNELKVLIKKT